MSAIEQCIQHYFDGLFRSDRAQLEQAFHKAAKIIGYGGDGKLNVMSLDDFLGFVDTVPSPEEAGVEYDMEILSIDETPTMAAVKVRDVYLKREFIDQLHLVRLLDQDDEEWRIIGKLFHSEKAA